MDIAGPKHLILDLTKKCNLSCFMCNTHASKGEAVFQTMSGEIFDKLVPVFPHVEMITLGGCGEPFMDADIFTRLELIRRLNPRVFIEVYSNATLLRDAERIEKAIEAIDKFQFSINAFTPERYESIMVGSRFEALRRNLALFSEVRRRSRRILHVTAECIIMRRNIDDLVTGVRFCKEFGIDTLVLKPLWIFDEVTRREFINPEGDEDRPRLESAMAAAWEEGKSLGVEVDIYHELRELYSLASLCRTGVENLVSKLRGWARKGPERPRLACEGLPTGIPCRDPWLTAQVFDDGWVYLCCQGVTEIGNLCRESFSDAWNGPEATAYREGLLSGRYYKACRTCNRVSPSTVSNYEKA